MVATPALSGESGDVEPPCKRWLSIDTIDEQYITNHARQVAVWPSTSYLLMLLHCQ